MALSYTNTLHISVLLIEQEFEVLKENLSQ